MHRRAGRCLLTALGIAAASFVSIPPAGASGFHCPGTDGSASESFVYYHKDGATKRLGSSSPARAFKEFLRTGSSGLHLPLTSWTHADKDLFVYDGIHGKIQVTTFRVARGTYAVGHASETCST